MIPSLLLLAAALQGEIPVTTKSTEAAAAFRAGREKALNFQNVEAAELFRKALAADPDFPLALAWSGKIAPGPQGKSGSAASALRNSSAASTFWKLSAFSRPARKAAAASVDLVVTGISPWSAAARRRREGIMTTVYVRRLPLGKEKGGPALLWYSHGSQ